MSLRLLKWPGGKGGMLWDVTLVWGWEKVYDY